MRLAKIEIANFKGLKKATFEPTKFSCLVGENNAGKSTVLQAVVCAIKRPGELSASLFHDQLLPVEFELSFSGVTPGHLNRLAEEHRAKIEPFVIEEKLGIVVRYPPGGKVEIKLLKRTPCNPNYRDEAINEVLKGKRGAAVRNALVEAFPEFANDAPEDINVGGAKEFLRGKIATLDADSFETSEAAFPAGIPAAMTALLPDPIYIPAVKNLSDDLKTTQSTTFGKLLGLLLEDMTPDLAQVAESLSQLDKFLNRVTNGGVEVDERHDKVKALETLVETYLSQNFPKARVQLHIPPPELKAILNSAQVYVDDGSRDLIDNKGDGIKRSLTFALLRAYVDRLAAKATTGEENEAMQPRLFLFEEPELYLHPKSQKILFDTLGRIAEVHQVVVTTHSPLFFAPGVTAGFVRVAKKDAVPKPIGILHPVNFELDATKAEVFRLTRFENADAGFFSSRVVLFEGESDDAFFKHVAKHLSSEWDFEQKNVALVRVSGKGNFDKYRKFFSAFGIDVRIVADLDALFDGYHHLGAKTTCDEPRSAAIQAIDARIIEMGAVAPPSSRQIKDRVKQDGWRQKYESARSAFRQVQETGTATPEALTAIDQLYAWEQEIARHRLCRTDEQARRLLVPVLDALRGLGICVLSRGAIEDYYPTGTPASDSKPERALKAAALVTNGVEAAALSQPLSDGRQPELKEILSALFDGL